MKKNILVFSVIFCLFVSCETDSKNDSKNYFIGTWMYHHEDNVNNTTIWLTFNKDGTFSFKREYTYYSTSYPLEFFGKYTYDDYFDKELNFIYTSNGNEYDTFSRYKFYDTYLRLWGAGDISGGNYYKQ